MDTDMLARLRICAYNADTGVEWHAVGNTLYYGVRDDEWIHILGGMTLIRHFEAAQPKTILLLLDEIDRLRKEK